MNDALIRVLLIAIALITIGSGLAQWIAPSFVLSVVATSGGPLPAHLFATVGMFMVITGAMFLQSLWRRSRESAIPLWIGLQKLAAACLVAWAVLKGQFAALALSVAIFDAVSAALALIFWQRLPR